MKNNSCWSDPSVFIKEIHVAEEIFQQDYTREILERAKLPVRVVETGKKPAVARAAPDFQTALNSGKQHLFLCENKGTFLKACPGTTEYQCCGYHVLNIGMNCPMDCVYCILQAYLNQPWLTAFVNIADLFAELDEALSKDRHRFFRVGTGEFTDSLALERLTGLSGKLVEYFAGHNNAVLELKTKSGYIDNLLSINHRKRTILSWSLNSQAIVQSQEIRAAKLSERLAAAKRGAEQGYGIGFHFDPIIYHHNWRENYTEIITLLFDTVPPESIVWISMGALRFLPPLKNISAKRFTKSSIFFQEFVTGLDGKSRYFRSLREEMYAHVYNALTTRAAADTCIYFCMESDEIWQKVTGFKPKEKGGIAAMLDEAARKSIAGF